MDTHTAHYALTYPLTLFGADGNPLPVTLTDIAATTLPDDTLVECRISIAVTPEHWQRIDREALFHLTDEARGPAWRGKLDLSRDVELELRLAAGPLEDLKTRAHLPTQVAFRLGNADQSQAGDPMLDAWSWYALNVKQPLELPPGLVEGGQLKVGFQTRWAEEGENAGSASSAASTPAAIGDEDREPWDEASIAAFRASLQEEDEDEEKEDEDEYQALFPVVAQFLQEDGWPASGIPDTTTLETAYVGDNGGWLCYAHTRGAQRQFIFYSVGPFIVSQEKRSAMAELLTRLNFGKPYGNFELNFDTGEFRFRTSIDVEGATLTPALVKPVVYANVTMMDRYLPAIRAVAEEGVDPAAAVAQIDG